MEFDLISAYSSRISWSTDFTPQVVECYSQSGFREVARCDEGDLALVIVNLEPSTIYNVKLTSIDGSEITSEFKTSSDQSPNLKNLYDGLKKSDGTYDTTRLSKKVHDIFLAQFSNTVRNGDDILATVSVKGVSKDIMTKAVVDGSSVTLSDIGQDKSLFLPFSKDCGKSMQAVTLVGDEQATLTYSPEQDNFSYAGEEYKVGDKLEIMGRMVTVADGSIVLIFSDTVAKTWDFSVSSALQVVGSAGSLFQKNLTANVLNLMTTKVDGATASTYASTWVHNTTDSTTEEITRIVSTIDENTENATLSLGVRHNDISGNNFIEPTIQSTYDATTISAQDSTDATRSATFNAGGLQFDSDTGAVYFGASQEFRFQFTAGTPNLLSIQAYDSVSLDYVTKQEFSDSTV